MYQNLKNEINQYIKTNGTRSITGALLNGVLNNMVDALGAVGGYGGIITPSSAAPQGDGNVFFVSNTAGTYTNFSNIVVNDNELAFIYRSGSGWAKDGITLSAGGTEVEANPTGEATETLGKLKIGETIYTAPQGPQGEQGPANKLSIGTVTDGEQAAASITGEAPNQQLNLVLPKGEQGDPGQNAVNPFKGWYTTDNIPTTGQEGDYCNVSNTSVTPHTVTIYRWSIAQNAFVDTGEVPDTATGETFASSEELNQVAIDDSHLVNPMNTADATQPVLAQADDVMDLKVKLEGVSASEVKGSTILDYSGYIVCKTTSGFTEKNYVYHSNVHTVFIPIPQNTKKIRFLGRFAQNDTITTGYAFINAENQQDIEDNIIVSSSGSTNDISRYIVELYPWVNNGTANNTEINDVVIPDGATYFCAVYGTGSITQSNFYCYLQSGESVKDEIQKIESDIDNIELFMQDYEQYEEVDMNKDKYKHYNNNVSYNGNITSNNGWTYIKIPVTGYSKVSFLSLIRSVDQSQGYCFQDENDNFFGGEKYKYASTSGTEEITLDIPEDAVWFYTNSRYSSSTYFTDNFFIKLIKGDTLKTIIDNAKQDCNSYTDTKVSDVEEEIDDINSLLTYSEGIEDKIEYARGGYTTSSKPTAYKGIEAANRRKLRIWNASNKSYYTYMPAGSSITAPEDCAKTYYRIYDTNKNLVSNFRSLSSGTVKTFSEDCYIVVYLYNEGSAYLWDTESNYSSGAITQLGTTVMQEYISGIVFDEKNINDRFDEFDERLEKVENGVTNKGLITMQLPSTAVEYHEQYDEMVEAGFLERHSATDLDESLLAEIPDALVDNPDYSQDKFPLYWYTLKQPRGYLGVSGHAYWITSDKIRPEYYDDNVLGKMLLRNKRTKILLISGQHGNEKAEPQALFEFVNRLYTDNEYADILMNCEFVIVPLLNPFGYNWDYRFTGKGYVGQIGGSPLTYHGWNINADFTDVQYYWYNGSSSSTFPKNRLYGFGTVGAKLIRKILEIEGNTGDGRFDLMIDLHQHDEDAYDNDNLRCLGGMTSVNYGNLTEEQKKRFIYLITEAGIRTDYSACISTSKNYGATTQTCFAWATGLSIGAASTTKGYIAGQNGLSTLYGTHYDGLPEPGQYVLGNTRHRGSSAKVTMTLETSTRCNYYNDAISDAAGKYNNIALGFANTYTDNILKSVIREMMSGSMDRDMSDFYDTPNHDWRYDDNSTQHPDE